jgi:hypothetical protein
MATVSLDAKTLAVRLVYNALAALIATCAAAEPVPEQPQSTIGYPTAQAALAALHAKPGVEFSARDGWTIAADPETDTVWSFPPEHDPAYPAVVRRRMTPTPSGGVTVRMDVLCSASKSACDDLVRAFERMNDEVKAQLQGGD